MAVFLAEDWAPIFQFSGDRNPIPKLGNDWIPWYNILCPTLLDKNICAISVTNPEAPERWQSAGHAYQKIRTGLTVGGSSDAVVGRRWVKLWEPNIIWFPWKIEGWELYFIPHRWHQKIQVEFFSFSGNVEDYYQS